MPLVYCYFGATLELYLRQRLGAVPPDPRIWDLILPQLQAPQHPQLSDPSAAYEGS